MIHVCYPVQLVLCITIEVKLDHETQLEVVLLFLGSLCLPIQMHSWPKRSSPIPLSDLLSWLQTNPRTKGMPENSNLAQIQFAMIAFLWVDCIHVVAALWSSIFTEIKGTRSPAYEPCSGPMVQHYCHGATIFTHPIAVRTLFNLNFKLKTPSDLN